MYKIYFKQALEMLKQNKFISIITIAGTALAITMIMVIIVTESIKNTSIAPEVNRNRTMYIKHEIKKSKDGSSWSMGSLYYKTYKEYLSELATPEYISVVKKYVAMATTEGNPELQQVGYCASDYNYWKIMSFSFVEGKPFTNEDFDSGLKKVVLSESTAHSLFGNNPALGKTVEVDFIPYTVTGIVKDVSPVFTFAQAEIYLPITSLEEYEGGACSLLLVAKDKDDFNTIAEEVRAQERKFNATSADENLTILGPYDHKTQILNTKAEEPDAAGENRKMIFIFCVLLLIPAVNLSSFSLSRIKKRTEEIGIRKAFGAKRHVILFQVLYENFITSITGGVIGLILSYIVVIWLKEWLLNLGDESSIPLETFISLPVFLGVFIVCLLLNMLSAGIPAYRASKISIVDSINQNHQQP
ncbi:ABC transporter permease [Prevotella sp. 10(H)]|uniref:ABC transporter permease n=1 Tax=Prevotella sp. 10(H) TaxID=1158294 RepID=UPI0004A73F71|nr:ABC transporter permease [Prevotella sp. 10(H)]